MTKISKLIVPIMLALGLSACGGGPDYASFCSFRAGAGCSAEGPEATCVASGEANTICKSEMDDYVDCVASNGAASDFTCNAEGEVDIAVTLCPAELGVAGACLLGG